MKLPGMPEFNLPDCAPIMAEGEALMQTARAELPRMVDALSSIADALHKLADK